MNWNKNKFLKAIHSSCLCIKYPFLYPRNRWDGRHWHSWKIERYLDGYLKDDFIRDERGRIRGVKRTWIPGVREKAWRTDIDYSVVIEPTLGLRGARKKVILSYPHFLWYYLVYYVYKYILPIFYCIPTYTEWDAMPGGWKKAFGDQYLKDLRKQLIKDKLLYKVRIDDLKEKFGTLRLYLHPMTDGLHMLIRHYEELSYHTCIVCGKPATKLTGGWICPYCDDHVPSRYVCATRDKDSEWKSVKQTDAKDEEEI